MTTYNYYYYGQIISKSVFLANNPDNWESEVNNIGEYTNGGYRANERD